MKLTKNFTLKELTKTRTGIPNNPSDIEIERLKVLCEKVLQPLRDIYGSPIIINSGYRSQAVNKKVGGVATSQHSRGEAVDITAGSRERNKRLFDIIKNNLEFDQLINEYDYSWVHVSYTICKPNRKQILSIL